MKLYKVARDRRIKVGDLELTFHRIDGMYSYCTDDEGNVHHIAASTDVEVVERKQEKIDRDDIIRLAREAGFAEGVVETVGLEGFANFAALVAAHEREACAKMCEQHGDDVVATGRFIASDGKLYHSGDHWLGDRAEGADECAELIRSRT